MSTMFRTIIILAVPCTALASADLDSYDKATIDYNTGSSYRQLACNVDPSGSATLEYMQAGGKFIPLAPDTRVWTEIWWTYYVSAMSTSTTTASTITCRRFDSLGAVTIAGTMHLQPSCASTVNDSAMGNLNTGTSEHHIGVSGTSGGTVRFTGPDMDSSGVLHLGGSADVLVQPDANHISTSPVSWTTPSDSTLNTHVTVNTKAKAGPLSSVLTATLTCQ